MCRFCSGMLTGVVVCLVCAVVAVKLIQGGVFSRPAEGSAEITEPLPVLADPVPLPAEPTPDVSIFSDSSIPQTQGTLASVSANAVPQAFNSGQGADSLGAAPPVDPPPSLPKPLAVGEMDVPPAPPIAGEVYENVPPPSLEQGAPPPADPIQWKSPVDEPAPVGQPLPTIPPSAGLEPAVPQTAPPPTLPAPAPSDPPPPLPPTPPVAPTAQPPAPAPELPAASGDVTLSGTHRCTLEEGHQLKLPDSVRLQIGRVSHLYLAPGPDGCLLICTPAALRQFIARRVEAEETDGLARAARRMFFARIERSAVDAGGSFRVTEEQARHAGLEREVVVVGVDDHLELWDVQRWKEYLERVSAPASTAPASTPPASTPPAVSPPAAGPQDPR